MATVFHQLFLPSDLFGGGEGFATEQVFFYSWFFFAQLQKHSKMGCLSTIVMALVEFGGSEQFPCGTQTAVG